MPAHEQKERRTMSFFDDAETRKSEPREPRKPKQKSFADIRQDFTQKLGDWLEDDPNGQKVMQMIDKMDDKKIARAVNLASIISVALFERRRAKKSFVKYQVGDELTFRDYETLATYAIGRAAFVAHEAARRHGIIWPEDGGS